MLPGGEPDNVSTLRLFEGPASSPWQPKRLAAADRKTSNDAAPVGSSLGSFGKRSGTDIAALGHTTEENWDDKNGIRNRDPAGN